MKGNAEDFVFDSRPEALERAREGWRRLKLVDDLFWDASRANHPETYPDDEGELVAEMAHRAQRDAIHAAGCCGLLSGLEMRETSGGGQSETLGTVACLDASGGPTSARLILRCGGNHYLDDRRWCFGGDYLALPSTRTGFSLATLEALDARLKEAGV